MAMKKLKMYSHLRVCELLKSLSIVQQGKQREKKREKTKTEPVMKYSECTRYEMNCDAVTKVHQVHPVFYSLFSFPSYFLLMERA